MLAFQLASLLARLLAFQLASLPACSLANRKPASVGAVPSSPRTPLQITDLARIAETFQPLGLSLPPEFDRSY